MFIPINNYLKKITYTLEHVIAPAIESDFERGQVLASIFLIDQLMDRVDYKSGLIENEISLCCRTIATIMDTIKEACGSRQEEISVFLKEIDQNGTGKGIEFRNKCDEILSQAIDFFFENRSKIGPDLTKSVNNHILDYLGTINTRDFSMYKMSTADRLVQTKD